MEPRVKVWTGGGSLCLCIERNLRGVLLVERTTFFFFYKFRGLLERFSNLNSPLKTWGLQGLTWVAFESLWQMFQVCLRFVRKTSGLIQNIEEFQTILSDPGFNLRVSEVVVVFRHSVNVLCCFLSRFSRFFRRFQGS